jgi:hypothetical protein
MKKAIVSSRVAAVSVLALSFLSALPAYATESRCTRALSHAESNLNDKSKNDKSIAAWMARGLIEKFINGDGSSGLTEEDRGKAERFASLTADDAEAFKKEVTKKLRAYRKKNNWVNCGGKPVKALLAEGETGVMSYFQSKVDEPEFRPAPHVCKVNNDKVEQPTGASEVLWLNDKNTGAFTLRACYAALAEYFCIDRPLLSRSTSLKPKLGPTENKELFNLIYNKSEGSWKSAGFPILVAREWPTQGEVDQKQEELEKSIESLSLGSRVPQISYVDDLYIGEDPETYRNRIMKLYHCTPDGMISESGNGGKVDESGNYPGECSLELNCRSTAEEEAKAAAAEAAE